MCMLCCVTDFSSLSHLPLLLQLLWPFSLTWKILWISCPLGPSWLTPWWQPACWYWGMDVETASLVSHRQKSTQWSNALIVSLDPVKPWTSPAISMWRVHFFKLMGDCASWICKSVLWTWLTLGPCCSCCGQPWMPWEICQHVRWDGWSWMPASSSLLFPLGIQFQVILLLKGDSR